MHDSPAASTPYEVLGVAVSASEDELRKAYRRLLRQTHPDVGGTAARFQAVQDAWDRVSSPERRAAYDRNRYTGAEPVPPGASAARPTGSRPGRTSSAGPRARMHGHPGGVARQQYLKLMREWSGRGTTLDDPYAPDLIRSAPREIRHWLAKALAEENTAQLVANLGIGYTAWHDVEAGSSGVKLDHVVLGPAGLFAIQSNDFGGPIELRRGELVGDAVAGQKPLHDLEVAAKALSKALRVKFTALIVVVPDAALSEPLELPARGRRPITVVVGRSRVVGVLRAGMPGMSQGSFEKVFELRSTLQNGIRLIMT
ncbi:DnaJ domain-containing protein [Glaciibacter psychrotolerans]|uniref:Heat-shock protein n=1 Tax=Glaciibacter psychrotolerans TaxID=670054 RepID=A0A7Z0ECV4_9MICO|nr:DnaJ domain-containing protein [Leifsonia psychrotolerans]NYJ19316.1 hypothetical protein [Leifsonia psychrotolerans]